MSSLEDVRTRLQNIDPYEFEDFVADLWEAQGWNTQVSQDSNDMGVDVVATRSDGMVDQKLVIQAKRYSNGNKIGRQNVQQYHSMKVQDAKADAAVIVTTSSFTDPAEQWAAEHNVKLIDGEDIIQILQDRNIEYLLDEYAPTLREETIDPAHEPASPTETDELGVEVEGEETVKLPSVLRNEDQRKKIAAGGVTVGILLFLNPTGTTLPIEAVGVLALLGAVAVYKYPEETWDFVTPTREEYHEFSNGGVVALDGDDIQYEPPNDSEPKVFGTETHSEERARQRAVVYGALDNYFGGGLPETEPGVLPTAITNQGERIIAAYRFAVHGENPSQIASEMRMSQQEVIDHLAAVVN